MSDKSTPAKGDERVFCSPKPDKRRPHWRG